jgi:hypothetical protein
MRDEARRLHDGVVPRSEEAREGVAQLVSRHGAIESSRHNGADPTEQPIKRRGGCGIGCTAFWQ